MGFFDKTVRQRRLAVIDMGDDAKIPDELFLVHYFTVQETRALSNYAR
jgi:hypothetical protein